MVLKEIIEKVLSSQELTSEEAQDSMNMIMSGKVSDPQLAAFLVALRAKKETPLEIANFVRVMREKSLKVSVSGDTLDTCGTGGDGKNSFNISTASAFVVAACGVKVAKHGNRAASSKCGSADLLEALGVVVDLSPKFVEQCIESLGIGFMFAPTFHPAMAHAVPVRKALGIRTVFNFLGPLTNPAGAERQLLGVAFKELGSIIAETLQILKTKHAIVVCGEEGIDEVSLSGKTYCWIVNPNTVEEITISPQDAGINASSLDTIVGGNPEENAKMCLEVLNNKSGPVLNAVVLNSAVALLAAEVTEDLREAVNFSKEVLANGKALEKLNLFINLTQKLSKMN